MRFFLAQGEDKKWHWILSNGERTVARSPQTYNDQGAARRALKVFRKAVEGAPVVVVKGGA